VNTRANDYNQIDENQNSGRVTMGLSVVMRVTLKDGTYHEVISISVSQPIGVIMVAFY